MVAQKPTTGQRPPPVERQAAKRLKSWLRRGAAPRFNPEFRQARHLFRELISCLDRRTPSLPVWPTQQTLANALGITDRWVRECLCWLVESGYIKAARWVRGKRSGYFIHPVFFDSAVWTEASFDELMTLPPWPPGSGPDAPQNTEKNQEMKTQIFKRKTKEKQQLTHVSPELSSGGSAELASAIPELRNTGATTARGVAALAPAQGAKETAAHRPPMGGLRGDGSVFCRTGSGFDIGL